MGTTGGTYSARIFRPVMIVEERHGFLRFLRGRFAFVENDCIPIIYLEYFLCNTYGTMNLKESARKIFNTMRR